MPASKPIRIAEMNQRYALQDRIGEGGMGLVYRAYDTSVAREVAVKTIRDAPDRRALDFFRKECGVLASLSHPNIVEIFDVGEFEEHGISKPYFVMPMLPGSTLDKLIRDSPQRLTVERCLDIVAQACRGLQAAHDKGLIHRDLKPSNIFVMPDDSVKIIDFGVAHLMNADVSRTVNCGTLPYMAPEQLESGQVSPLSDLFSLAVVLYEAVTLRRPFTGNTDIELANAIRKLSPPAASEINPRVNPMVSRIIHKALAKQPWYRFASVREFAETLRKAQRGEPIEFLDPIRIQPRLQRATRAAEQGDYQFASEILSELEAEGHLDPAIPVLLHRIEQGQRQKTVQQLLENAHIRAEEGEFLLARQKVEEALKLDAANTAAKSLLQAFEEKRNTQKSEEWFRLARQHLDNNAFTYARSAVQNVLQLQAKDSRAIQMTAEIDTRERDYRRLRNEKDQLYKSTLEAWETGDITGAISKLERLIELDRRAPDTATDERGISIQNLYKEVRDEHEAMKSAYEEARQHLSERDYSAALLICDKYLSKYPDYPLFQALKFDIAEQERQETSARIAEIVRRAEEEPDLDRKVNILEDAIRKYPAEGHFEHSLKLARHKRDLVRSIADKARKLEDQGQFNEALAQWEILRSVYAPFPGLDFEIRRSSQLVQEQSRKVTTARSVERIEREILCGNYHRALELAENALRESPGHPELMGLQDVALRGVSRADESRRLVTRGKELCQANRIDEGLSAMLEAAKADPGKLDIQLEVLEQAHSLCDRNLPLAKAVVRRVLEVNAGNAQARSLLKLIEDRERSESVSRSIARARRMQTEGNSTGALAVIEEAMLMYPGEPRLAELRASLKKAAELALCLDEVKRSREEGDVSGALDEVRKALATQPREPKLKELETALEQELRHTTSAASTQITRTIVDPAAPHLQPLPAPVAGPASLLGTRIASLESSIHGASTGHDDGADRTGRPYKRFVWVGAFVVIASSVLIWVSLTPKPGVTGVPAGRHDISAPSAAPSPVIPKITSPEPKDESMAKREGDQSISSRVPPSTRATWNVAFSTIPDGVVITADDGRTCTAPCTLDFAFGRHSVTATAPGYRSQAHIFQVPSDQTISFTLDKQRALVTVDGPEGAEVVLDGNLIGVPAGQMFPVPPGQHSFALRINGETAHVKDTGIVDGELVRLGASAEPKTH